jgi:hypothetical protein
MRPYVIILGGLPQAAMHLHPYFPSPSSLLSAPFLIPKPRQLILLFYYNLLENVLFHFTCCFWYQLLHPTYTSSDV